MKKQQEIPCGEKYLVLLIQWSVSFMLLVMTWLFWEHCSPKWLKPLCSPPVQCQSSCARGRRARLCCEHQQGFGGTEPSWAAACGALGDFPHPSARLEIPPSCFWQFSALGCSCQSLFCSWSLLWPACPGFAACIWSLLQILLVVPAPRIPDPTPGFPEWFLLTLWLPSFGFLGPKCDHSCLIPWLRQILLLVFSALQRQVSLSALDSKPSPSLALTRPWLSVSPTYSVRTVGLCVGSWKRDVSAWSSFWVCCDSWTHDTVHPWLCLCCCLAGIKHGLCAPNTANPAALSNTHISWWSGLDVV